MQVRCEIWWMPELDEKAHELRFTPAGVKIYEHWGKTKDVYYLRRNYERFMTMRPWSWEERYKLRVDEVEGGVIFEDHSTDGQFLDEIGRREPGPNVKSQPDHQVNLQGTGVIAKGVPADREIQFFGLPDYQGAGDGGYVDGQEDEEYYVEEYEYDGDNEEGSRDESEGGGLSLIHI